uniref:Uncharacterized protein n=1 Tax=Trypanosoma vivax (strain Y486) TaxID=1055687 RepID=G0UC03_TRYVY|nr:hypothetical protein TVY486_1108350 [Trypanosoma vivax Y486]
MPPNPASASESPTAPLHAPGSPPAQAFLMFCAFRRASQCAPYFPPCSFQPTLFFLSVFPIFPHVHAVFSIPLTMSSLCFLINSFPPLLPHPSPQLTAASLFIYLLPPLLLLPLKHHR